MSGRNLIVAPWFVGVVIPAQNEESCVERCIRSVLAAHAECAPGTRLWVVVVADSCSDQTALVARRTLGANGEVIEAAPRSPGSARRLGVAAVMRHFSGAARNRIWLANTDADTRVPADWLTLHLQHADAEATAVAGIVHLEEALDDDARRIGEIHLKNYALDDDGTHAHVHGANFGVRADAYLDVGGWSHVTVAEDHCLWTRLKLGGWRLCSPVRSFVVTSARLHGRAVGGFADTLRARVEADILA